MSDLFFFVQASDGKTKVFLSRAGGLSHMEPDFGKALELPTEEVARFHLAIIKSKCPRLSSFKVMKAEKKEPSWSRK